MNYEEAMRYVNGLSRFGMNLGLSRMTALLEKLGNPQNQLRFIHIAGTNGKGSTSTMLSNMLIHSGYCTGLFISPYVLCFRERMQVNGEMISEEEFSECASLVCQHADEVAAEFESPTQFELETAIAFVWYQKKRCDLVCLEVGLGGRFDATNVIPCSLLQVITSIGLDHTAILGDHLAQIAFEKAGIIKGGTTVLYPLQDPEVVSVIEKKCREVGGALCLPDLNQLHILRDDWLEGEFCYDGITYRKSLPGTVQIYNCITAIEAAKQLRKQGLSLKDVDIRYGIERTKIPARMELLSRSPLVILDGSHNPDGARALESTLKELSTRPITLLMGVLDDKDYTQILKTLAPYAKHLIAVTPDSPRALSAKEFAQQAKKYCSQVSYFEDVAEAIHATVAELPADEVLVICGSLYLASAARPLLLKELETEGDRVPSGRLTTT